MEFDGFWEPTYHEPDRNNPVIFYLRKKGIAEPMIQHGPTLLGAPNDGTPINLDLRTGRKATGVPADTALQITKGPKTNRPLLDTSLSQTPEVSGLRSIVHAALFVTFFYLGFIRKRKRHGIMTCDQDGEKVREVVTTWMRATAKGDLETVLRLIAEDAVFLLPDQPPMRGREAFAVAFRSMAGQVRIEGKPDIQEIHFTGDYAICWNQLSLTLTPLQGGPVQRRAGPTLSVFRKERDGRWVLFRDANMLS
jgi:uncharacterized protein (TIGR02246 family)